METRAVLQAKDGTYYVEGEGWFFRDGSPMSHTTGSPLTYQERVQAKPIIVLAHKEEAHNGLR